MEGCRLRSLHSAYGLWVWGNSYCATPAVACCGLLWHSASVSPEGPPHLSPSTTDKECWGPSCIPTRVPTRLAFTEGRPSLFKIDGFENELNNLPLFIFVLVDVHFQYKKRCAFVTCVTFRYRANIWPNKVHTLLCGVCKEGVIISYPNIETFNPEIKQTNVYTYAFYSAICAEVVITITLRTKKNDVKSKTLEI